MALQVLSVGQCVPDHTTLTRYLTANFEVEITPVALTDDAMRQLREQSWDLVLVNRKLDADYSDGMELIRRMKAEKEFAGIPVMLITNDDDQQKAAVAAGAEYGFGKLEYNKPETLVRLSKFLTEKRPAKAMAD